MRYLFFVAVALLVVTSASASYDTEEQSFLTLLNEYRMGRGIEPVALDSRLTEAADWMSHDLGTRPQISHIDSTGRDPWQRMCDSDYCYWTTAYKGEIIAGGHVTGQQVFDAWRNSPGHDAIMRDSRYTVVGIGRVYVPGSVYGWYWTADFGSVACKGDFTGDLIVTGSDLLRFGPAFGRPGVSRFDLNSNDFVAGGDVLSLGSRFGVPCLP